MKRFYLAPLLGLMTLVSMSFTSPAMAADEFVGYGVEDFNGPSDGECESSNLWWTIQQVNNFAKKFKTWSSWETVRTNSDQAVDGRDFTDASKDDFTGDGSCSCASYQASCSCKGKDDENVYGADHADVVVISTHGSRNVSGANASLVMGDSSNDCKVSWKNNLYWDTDTDILITEACHSADYGVWGNSRSSDNKGFYAAIPADSQFRALLGYHGLSKDKASTWSAPSFVQDSKYNDIVENWITGMYASSWRSSGETREICPTAIVFGESNSKIDSFADNGGFRDRKDTGSKTRSKYYYIGGCNPHGTTALPD
jgi:hypothetical protein